MARSADTFPTNGPVQRGAFDTDDLDIFEQAIPPWEVLFKTIGNQSFSHRKEFLLTPSLVMYRETFGTAIRAAGVTPTNMLALTIPERVGERTRYWNRRVADANVLLSDNNRGVDVVFDAGQTHWMVLADEQMLQRYLSEAQFARLRIAAAAHFLPVAPAQSHALIDWLSRMVVGCPTGLNTLRSTEAARAIEQAFAQRLAGLVTTSNQTHPRTAPGTRARGLKRAFDRIRSSPLDRISLRDLCTSAEVSRRTLEYAFRDQLGMSPQQYLRLRRLHAVRSELMLARDSDTTVTQVAHGNGFVDLGRFAGTYFSRFGEHPSQTLRRPPATQPVPEHHLLWSPQ